LIVKVAAFGIFVSSSTVTLSETGECRKQSEGRERQVSAKRVLFEVVRERVVVMLTLALRPPRQTSHIDSVRSLREEEATEKWGGDEKPRKREDNLFDRQTDDGQFSLLLLG
jgi:hypothetical protein